MYPDPRVAYDKVHRLVRRRRLQRRLKAASVLVGGLTVVAAATFGVDRGVVLVRRVWDAHHHHHHAAVSRTTSGSSTTSTTTLPGPPSCTSGEVAAGQSHWQVSGGTLYEIVVLDGTTDGSCTVAGYPNLSVGAPGGATLAAPVHDDPTLGAQAGATTAPVVIGSGQPAWFEVSYSVTCSSVLGPGESPSGVTGQCDRGASLGVLLPGTTTALDVAQPLGFTFGTNGFDVGAFAPGAPPDSAPVGQ